MENTIQFIYKKIIHTITSLNKNNPAINLSLYYKFIYIYCINKACVCSYMYNIYIVLIHTIQTFIYFEKRNANKLIQLI